MTNRRAAGWPYLTPGGEIAIAPCRMLLKDYAQCVESGEPVPRVVAEFLRHIAEQLLAGEDMRAVLRLQRPKHRPANRARDLAIARRCLALDLERVKLAAVYSKIAKENHLSAERVKKIYERLWFQASLDAGIPPAQIPSKSKPRVKK